MAGSFSSSCASYSLKNKSHLHALESVRGAPSHAFSGRCWLSNSEQRGDESPVMNGQDAGWPHRQDGRASLQAAPGNAPKFFRVRALD